MEALTKKSGLANIPLFSPARCTATTVGEVNLAICYPLLSIKVSIAIAPLNAIDLPLFMIVFLNLLDITRSIVYKVESVKTGKILKKAFNACRPKEWRVHSLH